MANCENIALGNAEKYNEGLLQAQHLLGRLLTRFDYVREHIKASQCVLFAGFCHPDMMSSL